MQAAFGVVKLSPDVFWELTPREFFNAWIGAVDHNTRQVEAVRDIVFSASRFNAANTAFSAKAARQISRIRFPWEKARKMEPLNYDKMKGFFNLISKKETSDG